MGRIEKITPGERIASAQYRCGLKDIREPKYYSAYNANRLAAMIDAQIKIAYAAGRKSVLDVAVRVSGIKDQKLPRNFGKLRAGKRGKA